MIAKIAAKTNQILMRNGLRLMFWLRYRRRHANLALEKIDGLDIVVPSQVFNPALFGTSLFLAKYIRQHVSAKGCLALDIGCGSGLLGLELGRNGAIVTATDINPEAVWATSVNAHLNGLSDQFKVCNGTLYEPVADQKFDIIVMNPPFYAHTPHTLLDYAFQAGTNLEVLSGMFIGAVQHLTPEGYALIVVSSTIPLDPILRQVAAAGLSWKVVATRRYWAEWHRIYELRLA